MMVERLDPPKVHCEFPKNAEQIHDPQNRCGNKFDTLIQTFNHFSDPTAKSYLLKSASVSHGGMASQVEQVLRNLHLFQLCEGTRRNMQQAISSILFSLKATIEKLEKEKTLRDLKKNRLGTKVAKSNKSELNKGS